MKKNDRIFIAGGTGMVGSAIIRRLRENGYQNLVSNYHNRKPGHQTLKWSRVDLTRPAETEAFFAEEQPKYVFLAAAKVGGILANNQYPAEFITINLAIQQNVITSAYKYKAERLLFLGSSCIYPQQAPQPMKEEDLLTGKLEPTNEPYAIAKITGIKMCEAYNRQYHTRFISMMPTNLYGPEDNFDLETSHVLPALIRKFHDARMADSPSVVIWGTGSPRREFLHVDDMAGACLFLMNQDDAEIDRTFTYPQPNFVNVGIGKDLTIKELAEKIKTIVGFKGDLVFDPSKPDGMPQKLLDVGRLTRLGWKAEITLDEGLRRTYAWYLEGREALTAKNRKA